MSGSESYIQLPVKSSYSHETIATANGPLFPNGISSRFKTFTLKHPGFNWTPNQSHESLVVYKIVYDYTGASFDVNIPLTGDSLPESSGTTALQSHILTISFVKNWYSHSQYGGTLKLFVKVCGINIKKGSTDTMDSYFSEDVTFVFPEEIDPITNAPRYFLAQKKKLEAASSFFVDLFKNNTFSEGQKYTLPAAVIDYFEKFNRGEILPDSSMMGGKDDSQVQIEAQVLQPTKSNNMSYIRYRVPITTTTYRTYRALYYYLENDIVIFDELDSLPKLPTLQQPSVALPIPNLSPTSIDEIMRKNVKESLKVSPQSIYILADILSLTKLKSLALESFTIQLSTSNILEELFSEFSMSYKEVGSAALKYASENWAAVLQERKGIEKLRREIVSGEIEGERAALAIDLLMMAKFVQEEQVGIGQYGGRHDDSD